LSGTEQRYLISVGEFLLERDELLANIAALDSLGAPNDPARQREAEDAAARQRETQEHVDGFRETPARQPVSADVKDLFREAAKRLHPDKGHSPEDRKRRTAFMARLNAAYITGDATAIRNLMEDFQLGEAMERNEESLFTVDAMNVLIAHLNRLTLELRTLQESALGQLYAEAQKDADGETGFLIRQRRRLALQIIDLKERLLDYQRPDHV
jgi:hypothetical protein